MSLPPRVSSAMVPCSLYPFLAASLLVASLSAVPPSDYLLWTAAEKRGWMLANLDIGRGGSSDMAPFWSDADYPPNDPLNFCMVEECIYPGGDSTHKDFVCPYGCRQSGIHPTGLVAQVKIAWDPNPYTGMFQRAEYGFARWGYQKQSDKMFHAQYVADAFYKRKWPLKPMMNGTDWTTTDCLEYDCFNLSKGLRYEDNLEAGERPDFQQFMALKFFRDGVPSANIHTANPLYSSWNHFGQMYTNLQMNIGQRPNETDLESWSVQATQRGTQWPGFTGLHDMAMYDQAGTLQHNIDFPYQLIFMPATEAGVIPHSVHGHYSRTVELAGKWGPGTTLFHIMAKRSFSDPVEKIGELQLASKIMMSADADRQAFFAHPRYDRDIVLRPQLIEPPGCMNFWECPLCPIVPQLCSPSPEDLKWWKDARNAGPGRLAALASQSFEHLPRWSCAGYSKLTASPGDKVEHPKAQSEASMARTLPQMSASLQRRQRGLKRRQLQLQPEEEMRSDDLFVEPLSRLKHKADWFCQQDPNVWPNAKRMETTSSCEMVKLPGLYDSEPEWALADGCTDVRACDSSFGMWYSSTYPCKCGSSTCLRGQLCTASKNSCVPWGPRAGAR